MKINIWKKWRKSDKNTLTTEKVSKPLEDIWLGRLEETLARMKTEVEKIKAAKISEEKRRTRLLYCSSLVLLFLPGLLIL